jgi:mono/diheme cytochrome c family protein
MPNAGFVLGPKTRQLNLDHAYAEGRVDNQLRTWSYLQMFTTPVEESAIKGYAKSCSVGDETASLEDRVRSYLDVNCSACHRPGGTGASWDARFGTPLAERNIFNGELRDTMGVAAAKVAVAGDPARSMLHLRMASTTFGQQMPPLTRNVVDRKALDLVEEWIREKKER